MILEDTQYALEYLPENIWKMALNQIVHGPFDPEKMPVEPYIFSRFRWTQALRKTGFRTRSLPLHITLKSFRLPATPLWERAPSSHLPNATFGDASVIGNFTFAYSPSWVHSDLMLPVISSPIWSCVIIHSCDITCRFPSAKSKVFPHIRAGPRYSDGKNRLRQGFPNAPRNRLPELSSRHDHMPRKLSDKVELAESVQLVTYCKLDTPSNVRRKLSSYSTNFKMRTGAVAALIELNYMFVVRRCAWWVMLSLIPRGPWS